MRPLKDTQLSLNSLLFFLTMSKQVLISLLAQGNTGNEILSILDAIVADQVSEGTDNVEEETAI